MKQALSQFRQSAARLRRKFGRSGRLILLYHRIADPPSDPWALSVTPSHFAEHLEVVRKHLRAVPLADLVSDDRRNGTDPAVALTFDDGYADNLRAAKPPLQRWDVPCTFFLASGHLGRREQFWWDQLARALLETTNLPPSLRLTIGGRRRRWELGPMGEPLNADVSPHRRWLAWGQPDRGPRDTAFRELYGLLQPMTTEARRIVVEEIIHWAGIDVTGPVEDWPLTHAEAVNLADGDLIDVGAHTVSHPQLGSMPLDVQRDEIAGGKVQLEQLFGRSIRLFAYPFGRSCDYTADTVSLGREANYDAACSNFSGVVRPGTDRWQLPRFQVHDWDGDEFLQRLELWLDG